MRNGGPSRSGLRSTTPPVHGRRRAIPEGPSSRRDAQRPAVGSIPDRAGRVEAARPDHLWSIPVSGLRLDRRGDLKKRGRIPERGAAWDRTKSDRDRPWSIPERGASSCCDGTTGTSVHPRAGWVAPETPDPRPWLRAHPRTGGPRRQQPPQTEVFAGAIPEGRRRRRTHRARRQGRLIPYGPGARTGDEPAGRRRCQRLIPGRGTSRRHGRTAVRGVIRAGVHHEVVPSAMTAGASPRGPAKGCTSGTGHGRGHPGARRA